MRALIMGFAALLVGALPASATTWLPGFTDNGTTTDWHLLYTSWGTDGQHTIANTPDGLHVAGGGTPGHDEQRVLLWLKTPTSTADYVLQFSVRRNDSAVPVGTATMLILSGQGVSNKLPLDPTTVNIPAPSLDFVDNSLTGLRLSMMTAYNPIVKLNSQLRLRQLPGAAEVQTGSLNQFPFTTGVWYQVNVTKLGSTVTVNVTPTGGAMKSYSWTAPVIPARKGNRIGFYLQEGRDITLKNITLLKRG